MADFFDASEGNSNFKLIEQLWHSKVWGSRSLHRICTLMRKLKSLGLIVEQIDHSHLAIAGETSALNTFFGADLGYTIYRLSFLDTFITDEKELESKADQIKVFSSIILVNFTLPNGEIRTYVYSAIIHAPFMKTAGGEIVNLLNNYMASSRKFDCEIEAMGKTYTFQVAGTFFAQQNQSTSVCAHACLCMTINNMDDRTEPNICSEDINRILGYDHNQSKVQGGLSKDEIVTYIESMGHTVDQNSFIEGHPNSNFAEYSYRYMESKCPSMLIFTTSSNAAHVVPIVGHTLNTDLWRPEAEIAYSSQFGGTKYRTAAAWVDHFIIHDDNFGSNYCLPVDALDPYPNLQISTKGRKRTKKKAEKKAKKNVDLSFKAICALSIVPNRVNALASKAEWASIGLLEQFSRQFISGIGNGLDYWLEMLVKTVFGGTGHPFVARTLLTGRDFYIQGLNEENFDGETFSKDNKTMLTKDLPEEFWLTEITLPDIYTANKSKLADFIYRSDIEIKNEADIGKNWIQVRLPGLIIKKNMTGPLPADVQVSDVKGHYPILRPMSDNKHFEW